MIDDPGRDWNLNDFPNISGNACLCIVFDIIRYVIDQKSVPDVVTSVVVLNKAS